MAVKNSDLCMNANEALQIGGTLGALSFLLWFANPRLEKLSVAGIALGTLWVLWGLALWLTGLWHTTIPHR